ncbi:Putative ribonuclease H protein [Dendrobium catenatum]|uniref:Ribonuclease H protein n=1 Tax=Dendrobium catenatum TaxID=906689 RepID=A0A2I0VND2_9ASPA|nr:Putative ribonuclease H protein [Dendrobium catenatum]
MNGKRGMHYVGWKTLCKTKASGGLNFHSAVSRSGPLKARLSWRFLQNKDSLLYQVISAKYGNNLWDATNRRGSSIVSKILLEGAQ